MPLTDIAIRQAKATEKPFKLSDGGGLHLLVTPTGGKLWRLAYRFDGKQRKLAFGGYPEVTLKDARARRDAAKDTLAAGVDPGAKAKIEKRTRQIAAGNTFGLISAEYVTLSRPDEPNDRGALRRLAGRGQLPERIPDPHTARSARGRG